MSLHEAAWRIPSRPCPFYQKGNCIFAARCNFLHVIQAKGGADYVSRDSVSSPSGRTPILRVDLPASSRSPPVQRLLSALSEVIDHEPQDDAQGEAYTDSLTLVEPNSATAWSAGLPTFIHGADTTFFARVTDTMAEIMRMTDGEISDDEQRLKGPAASSQTPAASPNDNTLRLPTSSLNDPLDTPSIDTTHSSPDAQYIEMPSIPDNHNDLLSPVDLSHLHLNNFHLDDNPELFKDTSSIDSGFVDSCRRTKSPSRSPVMSSTFELLHSPFGSPSARVLSPRIGSFIGHSPSTAPESLPFKEQQFTLENDLDSPIDRIFSTLVPEGPEPVADRASQPSTPEAGSDSLDTIYAVDVSTELSMYQGVGEDSDLEEEKEQEQEDERPEEDDSDGHTSVWHPADAETAVFIGSLRSPLTEEVEAELNRQSVQSLDAQHLDEDTPVWNEVDLETSMNDTISSEALSNEIQAIFPPLVEDTEDSPLGMDLSVFLHAEEVSTEELAPPSPDPPFSSPLDDNDVVGNQSDSPRLSPTDDSTAYLEYLQADSQDGDTLYSLYDIYSSDLAQSPKPSSLMESPLSAGPLRERVFTPPPPSASRSGFVYPRSTPSSSPVTSLMSASKSRASPTSSGRPTINNLIEVGLSSKKVPFGFRSSRSQGHSVRPSLVLNQGRSLSRLNTNPSAGVDDSLDPPTSTPPSSASSTGPLRPLRLSVLSNSRLSHSVPPSHANIYPESAHASLSSVPSRNSLLAFRSLSSAPATANFYHSWINVIGSRPRRSPSLLTDDLNHLATFDSSISAPVASPPSWPPHVTQSSYRRPPSGLSDPIYEQDGEDETTFRQDLLDEFIRRPIEPPRPAPSSRPESVLGGTRVHAIATPKPTLMFAIASDEVEQVRRVLENGDADPNDSVGPQSALQFALTNDQLTNKLDIIKTLLAFGADPSQLTSPGDSKQTAMPGEAEGDDGSAAETGPQQMLMDPATRYYIERADAAYTRKTSSLIHRSFFRPLTRVRYDLVGQDRALEELFRLLSIHSRKISVSPVVVMFSGPSGHGKSLLARKFGALLDVPTHTVNMVTVRSQDSLWESYSMNPHEEPTNCTLSEFLVNNEGKRCVVVLDEIEKVDNEKVLWSLLMPWEYGRCSFEAKSRHVDVRNVIWLCTSNIGHDLVFEHCATRENPEEMMTRKEFLELVALLRPRVSERLGASVLSRITSVLPFVPFTLDEKRAVCAEVIYQLGGEEAMALSMEAIDSVIQGALEHYIPEEGARSLHRAVSNQLVEVI